MVAEEKLQRRMVSSFDRDGKLGKWRRERAWKRKIIAHKIMLGGLWWYSVHKFIKEGWGRVKMLYMNKAPATKARLVVKKLKVAPMTAEDVDFCLLLPLSPKEFPSLDPELPEELPSLPDPLLPPLLVVPDDVDPPLLGLFIVGTLVMFLG